MQMFIGDGAKMVRDAFALAKEKSPCIIFIDEIDAIGTKRFDSELSGDREVQRTMLELLNQLDGFTSNEDVKVRVLVGGRRSPDALGSKPLRQTFDMAGIYMASVKGWLCGTSMLAK